MSTVPEWFSRLDAPLKGRPVCLEQLSWTQIESMLRLGEDMLILPIGAIEQHGAHLPINTDSTIVTAVAQYASAMTGVPILPTMNFTSSVTHTEKWPGTFSIFPETLMHSVSDIIQWSVAAGWRKVIIINSHAGNDAPLRTAIDRLRFDHVNTLQVALRNTWNISPEVTRAFHVDAAAPQAGQAETDLMLFLAPELVRMEVARDEPDLNVGKVFCYTIANKSSTGVVGTPSKGTAEQGKELFQEMGKALVATLTEARGENPPVEWHRATQIFGFPPEPHPTSHKQF